MSERQTPPPPPLSSFLSQLEGGRERERESSYLACFIGLNTKFNLHGVAPIELCSAVPTAVHPPCDRTPRFFSYAMQMRGDGAILLFRERRRENSQFADEEEDKSDRSGV